MRPRTRHTRTHLTFTPLTGGINVADAPHLLAEGDMTDCVNFLYEQGSQTLRPRGGLTPIADFPQPIRAVYHDIDTRLTFVFLTDRTAWRLTEGSDPTYIGTLTGDRIPSCAKFQNKLCIASGGALQTYDYSAPLTTIAASPLADLLFVRGGRLLAARTGSDRLRFSAIGDLTAWDTDPQDPSSAAWLDIGYGDSGDITALVPLAADLIILKSNGGIYQLTGDTSPAAWRVTQLAGDTDPVGLSAAAHLGGSIVYLSRRGLVSLAATSDYGNITASDIADKVRPLLTDPVHDARLYPLKRRGLLLLRPTADARTLIAYHSRTDAATRLTFPLPVTDITETDTAICLAAHTTLYRLSDETLTDNGTPIDYRIALRHIRTGGRIHLAQADLHLTSQAQDSVHLTADHPTHPLTTAVSTNKRTLRRLNHTTDTLALTLTSHTPFTPHTITAAITQL